MRRAAIIAASLALAAAPACGEPHVHWPNAFLSRVEMLAFMQTLNAKLLASRSATLVLEKWCGDHHMAAEAKVTARRVAGVEKPASAETRQRLQLAPDEPVKYRRVQLVCGGHVLSEADNWYAPRRLTGDMNRLLETTDTPFGKAVLPLAPFRRTIEANVLWSPLPEGWESKGAGAAQSKANEIDIPPAILEHRALVFGADQKPFSEVDETYTSEVLDFEVAPPP